MPTYQYACTDSSCANRFELVQSFTDPAASECPVCGSRVRKVYGSVGVVFKGSGFYRTDSRNASDNGSGAKSEGAKTDGVKADGAKTETGKPESKSGSKSESKADTSSSTAKSSSSPAAAAS